MTFILKRDPFCFVSPVLEGNTENVSMTSEYDQARPPLAAKTQTHAKAHLWSKLLVTLYSSELLRSQILGGDGEQVPVKAGFPGTLQSPSVPLWFHTHLRHQQVCKTAETWVSPSTWAWTRLVNHEWWLFKQVSVNNAMLILLHYLP